MLRQQRTCKDLEKRLQSPRLHGEGTGWETGTNLTCCDDTLCDFQGASGCCIALPQERRLSWSEPSSYCTSPHAAPRIKLSCPSFRRHSPLKATEAPPPFPVTAALRLQRTRKRPRKALPVATTSWRGHWLDDWLFQLSLTNLTCCGDTSCGFRGASGCCIALPQERRLSWSQPASYCMCPPHSSRQCLCTSLAWNGMKRAYRGPALHGLKGASRFWAESARLAAVVQRMIRFLVHSGFCWLGKVQEL